MGSGDTYPEAGPHDPEPTRVGMLWSVHRWLTQPTKPLEDARFELFAVNNWAMALGLLSHLTFLGLFVALGIMELAWLNVGSVVIFVAALWLSRRARLLASLGLAAIEVVAHAWIVTAWLGWRSGFHLHILLALELLVLFGWISLRRRILGGLVLSAAFVGLMGVAADLEPAVRLEAGTELGLAVMNAVVLTSVSIGMLAYHTWTVDATRRARELAVEQLHIREHQLQIARDDAVEARAEAEGGSRAKSDFLANMSHELRTPLNAIIGYSEMISEDAQLANDSNLVEEVARITAAGQHLLALINDILDLSKIEAGRMDVEVVRFDLAACVEQAMETARPLASKNHNTLDLTLAPEVGEIESDPTKVRQILLNLLSNACKFTEAGTVHLAVGLTGSTPRPMVEFVVTDTGIGIEESALGRIFDEFAQGDQSTTRRFGGTGLGLAITRRFCELLDGTIAATSEPGVGSRFEVRLPIAAIDAPES